MLPRSGNARSGEGWWAERGLLIDYAIPALLCSALVGPAHTVVQAILANRPDGFAQVAILGIALQWFTVVMFIPANAGKVVLPILTDLLASEDHRGSRQIMMLGMLANAVVAVPLALLMCLFSPAILSLYGPDFTDATWPLRVAVCTAALLAIIGPVGTLMSASARMWLAAATNAGWALVYIGSAYLWFGKDAMGVTIALATAYVIHSIWTLAFAWRRLKE